MNRKGGQQDWAAAPPSEAQAGFGQDLRKQREACGWSRRELAERAGVSADTVKQIENGSRGPLPTTQAKLAEALKISLGGSADNVAPLPQERDERCVIRRVTLTITVEEWVDPQLQSGLS